MKYVLVSDPLLSEYSLFVATCNRNPMASFLTISVVSIPTLLHFRSIIFHVTMSILL